MIGNLGDVEEGKIFEEEDIFEEIVYKIGVV